MAKIDPPSAALKDPAAYYSVQYNARASIPDHPQVFSRWQDDSAEVRRKTPALLDLPYGEASGERLDFFPTRGSDAPLLVFIHGGWWRSLDKSDFSTVGRAYSQAGMNVALTNYTLAPKATIEQIVLQQLHALTWLYRNAERYDFDRNRIVVAGHSAGAHLAAMMMAADWPVFGPDLPADLVKGGILLSGLYDLAPVPHAAFVNVDLKLDAGRAAALSPAHMAPSFSGKFITAAGGLESSEFQRQTALIEAAWAAQHRARIALPEQNHLTICDSFVDPEHALFKASAALVKAL